ncbi:nitroreductase family deazaflavin-dependent oxidoreductase [Rhodococcus opacus]|nr:nitroreductase family deazaflavin-dependent oxidoreductase [Rhodococcus sp. IEGM 248]NHU41935.1 nitroreductase family deazaflavin-dependent oxidoreductase [Rhodococcus sp. A14]RKM74643.1 nitroreductase family deazaflavin-dependent oxidoreductase [Rhodococcus opacus]
MVTMNSAPTTPPRPRGLRNPLRILARWLGTREWVMRMAPIIIWLESHLRAWTGNRVSLIGIAGLQSVQVTVPGRKSGTPRTTALLCIPYGDGYIVTGSNWGRPEHPTWSVNLRAADEAQVKAGSHESRMSVRMVTGDERENLWKLVVDYWPGYLMEHRRSGGREFRLFVLEPTRSATESRES